MFAGVAAVTVQLSSTTRGASGLAAAALGLAFVLSGVGNMLGSVDASGMRLVSAWPAWLSPMGWGQQMRPFGGDHWWPLGLFAVAFVALVGVAGALATRRDVGRGILAERRGRAEAAARAAAVRSGWSGACSAARCSPGRVGMLGFGLVFGAIIDEVADTSGATTEWYERMGGSDADPRRLPRVNHRDGRHGRRDLRRPGAAADARRGGRRPRSSRSSRRASAGRDG